MKANIIEVRGKETKGRGEFEFLQLPGAGDHIVLGRAGPGLEIMRTLYVEHEPVSLPLTKVGASIGPSASVYVEHHSYWDHDMVE